MNEQEWLECSELSIMLASLRDKASDRKLRLFTCACCHRIWHLLTDERSRHAVNVAERYADGEATAEELTAAYYQANATCNASDPTDVSAYRASRLASITAYWAALYCAESSVLATDAVADTVADISTNAVAYRLAKRSELAAQCQLLRDIFCNPFRPVTINPAWLAWNDGMVRRITQSIYDENTFDRMHLLANALTDAGCDNQNMLNHCRSDRPHVKGCWVLDLLLGKE